MITFGSFLVAREIYGTTLERDEEGEILSIKGLMSVNGELRTLDIEQEERV